MRKQTDRDRYGSIYVKEIYVKASPGANVNECISDSLMLALRENRKVICKHNDKLFTIVPTDIINTLHDEHEKTEFDD